MTSGDGKVDTRQAGVTLHDVARAAEVHPSTVSRALDPAKQAQVKESTRRRILEVADQLGYRPDMVARGLKSGKTGTVGVIVADLGNTFVTPLIHGIAAALESAQMLPIIAETQDDHARLSNITDHMLSRRVDGLIAVAARTADQGVLEAANRLAPVVLASRPLEGTTLRQVIQDDEQGGRLAAEHLGALGHRTVAQLEGPEDVLNFPRRAAGFRAVAEEMGMEEIMAPERADRPIIEEGERLMEGLLDSSAVLPTALFAHNDLIALGALSVLRRRGLRVPEDISLVGYNDMPFVSHLTPPLTTVRYLGFEEGGEAGRVMVSLLAGDDPGDVVLGPTLVSRGSARRI